MEGGLVYLGSLLGSLCGGLCGLGRGSSGLFGHCGSRLLDFFRGTKQGVLFSLDAGSTTLTGSTGLDSVGFGLIGQALGAGLFSLGLVNEFHQDALVLKHIALGLEVQLMVQMLVNLARLPVFAQQSAQHSLAAHPEDRLGHAGISGTVTLTRAAVPSLSLGNKQGAHTEARVDGLGLADDQTVLDQVADVLA